MAAVNPRMLTMDLAAGVWTRVTNAAIQAKMGGTITEFSKNNKKNFQIDVQTAATFNISFGTAAPTTNYMTIHTGTGGIMLLNSIIQGDPVAGTTDMWLMTAANDVASFLITDETN